ncbi:MAG TPA: chloride channel protein, partial [Rhizomicrobium sp.]|nr:chloride channel protein [Rhizomicrobium sp.]
MLSSLARRTRQFWSIAQRYARSSEPSQIVACGISGAVIGAMIALLHRFVDQLHRIMFNLPAGYTLSTGIGLDLARVLFVPLIGGLLLGAGALATRWFGERLSLRRADQRIFVGAGAAAAIAAAFNAPLAGAFYGFELIIGTYMTRALAPVAAAVLAGTMAERAVVNPEPLFVIGQAFHLKQSVYLLF